MILEILQYGDPILRAKGERIEKIDDRIRELARNMIETMHAAHGVGLAAQQVGQPLQLTVLDISAVEDRPSTLKLSGRDVDPKSAMPIVLINPEIEVLGPEREAGWEGCLSVPGLRGLVERPAHIRYRGVDHEGHRIERIAKGFHARVVQHECDHLDGIVYPMRMTDLGLLAYNEEPGQLAREVAADPDSIDPLFVDLVERWPGRCRWFSKGRGS